MGIKRVRVPVRRRRLQILVLLALVAGLFASSYSPLIASAAGDAPGVGISGNLRNASWLHKGLIKLTNKSGKTWYFTFFDETSSTLRFGLKDGEVCKDSDNPNVDNHLENRPEAYLSVSKSNLGSANYLKKKATSETCAATYDDGGNIVLDTTASKSLFWKVRGSKKISVWHNNGTIAFEEAARPGDKTNWRQYYVRSDEPDNVCRDVIALTSDNKWILFPMMEWTGDNPSQWPYAEGAKSEGFHYLRTTANKTDQGSIYETCRVSSHRLPNEYLLGAINSYDEVQELTTPKQYSGLMQEIDGNGVGAGDDDDVKHVCNMYGKGDWVYINPAKAEQDYDKSHDGEYDPDWDNDDAPEDDYGWVKCTKGDDTGDGTKFTLDVWENRDYGMGDSTGNRLLGLEKDGMEYWKWEYSDAGDLLNDGYRLVGKIADIPTEDADAAGAQTDINVSQTDDGTDDGSGSGSESTSCSVEGIGWIVCPVMNFIAKLNDSAFEFLKSLLTVRPALIQDSATQSAWAAFRDLANVAFVIAFMVIVYSQLTSAGISNYGIKKLMPKVIIAAILVNISYFICAVMVDLSNIVGSSVYGLLASVAGTGGGSAGAGGAATWSSIMTVVLAGAAVILLVVLVILAPMTLVALGVVLLILVARQALVILLLVIAPLAFVAYLLPNTEQWFKKWWGAFVATLMVYPVVGVIFGASTLASNILMQVAGGSGSNDEQLLKIVALAVLAVPLFTVPAVLKGSLSSLGAIGARVQGLADRAQNRASGDFKKQAGDRLKDAGNRFGARALDSTSRRGAFTRAVTGIGRRAARQDRYKQNQTRRDAANDNFLNGGFDENGNPLLNNKGQIASKSARLRSNAASAQKTAEAGNKLITNSGALSSLSNNQALHASVAASNAGLHHQEDIVKNRGEANYYNNPDNQHHIEEHVESQERRQEAETNAINRAKTGGNIAVRQAILDNKTAKGEEKIIDTELEIEHQGSTDGMRQAKTQKIADTQLEIVKGEQGIEYEKSTEGKNQTVIKDEQQQRKVVAQAANEKVAIETNEALRVDAAAAQATVDAAKAKEQALVEELKTDEGALANPEYTDAATILKASDTVKRVQTQRATSASGIANVAYATAVKDSAGVAAENGGLAAIAGGIDKAGAARAIAAATQVVDKQLTEAIGTQKTTMESLDANQLMQKMMDTSLSAEERAAAGGLLMSRGGDQHVQEVWDYMGKTIPSTTDEANALVYIQKQVAADGASRKPVGYGKTDLSYVAQGKLGAANVERDEHGEIILDPATGKAKLATGAKPFSYDDSLVKRVSEGKIGPEEIAKMGADELTRLSHLIQKRSGDGPGQISDAMHTSLVEAISKVEADENLKVTLQSDEKQEIVSSIRAKSGVPAGRGLQRLDFDRTYTPPPSSP